MLMNFISLLSADKGWNQSLKNLPRSGFQEKAGRLAYQGKSIEMENLGRTWVQWTNPMHSFSTGFTLILWQTTKPRKEIERAAVTKYDFSLTYDLIQTSESDIARRVPEESIALSCLYNVNIENYRGVWYLSTSHSCHHHLRLSLFRSGRWLEIQASLFSYARCSSSKVESISTIQMMVSILNCTIVFFFNLSLVLSTTETSHQFDSW